MLQNDCRFIGNLTHPPHFRRVGQSQLPFLRLYVAVDNGQDGPAYVRVVAYGEIALLTHPYLQTGSKVMVQARYRQRKRHDNGETVHEFVAQHIVFIDKIDWERGDAARRQA
ncbi:MAG: single-stranded DNA-binding protein [Anaerolineae bacterium]|nr:single-stranded DNA-binding protein [Anaerolineae bacterium]